ncbi:MAG: RsmE family RNA methyltransferase [bacterium]
MKIHRFIGSFDFSKKEIEITNPENIKQIKDILRLQKGEKVILSDGNGTDAEVTLNLISKNKITSIVKKIESAPELTECMRKVNLYLAILKKENFELAVQKTVEIGVHRIIPIITERTIKTGLNFARLEKIMIEASEQSGRSFIPILSPIMNFKEALIDGSNNQEKTIFTPPIAKNGTSSKDDTYEPNKEATNISIFIGPEGGFTEKEIKEATEAGYNTASLGSLTLRGETAAMIATYRTAKGI